MNTTRIVTGGSVIGLLGIASVLLQPEVVAQTAASTPPDKLVLIGTIRDFPPGNGHPDFSVNPSMTPGAKSAKTVMPFLDGDGKPVFNPNDGMRLQREFSQLAIMPNGSSRRVDIAWCMYDPNNPDDEEGKFKHPDNNAIASVESFAQWFRDVPGVNMSRLWTLTLNRVNDPHFGECYSYETNNFHPIDDQLLGNGPDEHNFYFTYEIVCQFKYDASARQFFWFKGDDDCWVFINNRLGIDHGGIAANREMFLDVDRFAAMEGIQDGETCTLHFFLAERCQPQSQFRIKTNIATLGPARATSNAVFAAFD